MNMLENLAWSERAITPRWASGIRAVTAPLGTPVKIDRFDPDGCGRSLTARAQVGAPLGQWRACPSPCNSLSICRSETVEGTQYQQWSQVAPGRPSRAQKKKIGRKQ